MAILLRIIAVIFAALSGYIFLSGGIQTKTRDGGTMSFDGISLILLGLAPAILALTLFFIAAEPDRKRDFRYLSGIGVPFLLAGIAVMLAKIT